MRIENSFIPVEGVGERTERKLWREGVTHWDAFDPDGVSALGRTRADRVQSFIDEARARLDAGDADYFGRAFPRSESWRLYGNFCEEACFFDIETTGLDRDRDEVTCVSFHRGNETTTLVSGEDLTARAVREQFADASLLVTFNGARFDVPFLESALDLDVTTPHVDLMYPCRRLGLTGGLKTVESDLGVDRDRPDLDGRDAVRLWRRYERGDDAALDTLVSYNRDDAVNLRAVMDAVADALHDEVFEAARA